MALFRRTKETKEDLSEPPVLEDPLKGLAKDMARVNSLQVEASASLDGRVRELEAVYKSNKILSRKILKQLESLHSCVDNIKDHDHIVALQKDLDKLTNQVSMFTEQQEKLHSVASEELSSVKKDLKLLSTKEDLKKLQDKTKEGFKVAEQRFTRTNKFSSLEKKVEKLDSRLNVAEDAAADVDVLRMEFDNQKEQMKNVLELIELLSKKMVM